jgi:hypothetical protein
MNQSPSTVKVFDAWVQGQTGTIHFDVMTTDEATALRLAKEYLLSLGEESVVITAEECQYCHSEPLVLFSQDPQKTFLANGGFILPLPCQVFAFGERFSILPDLSAHPAHPPPLPKTELAHSVWAAGCFMFCRNPLQFSGICHIPVFRLPGSHD